MEISEPCKSCHMLCCTRFTVPLSAFDILRICKRLSAVPLDFCHLVDAATIEQAPHANVFILDAGRKLAEKAVVLRKIAKGGACMFFSEDGGCGIHGSHPLACRIYPFVTDGKGGLKFNRHLECPRKWKEGEYDEDDMLGLVGKIEEEIAAHDRIVRKWNATLAKKANGPDAQQIFFEFLLKEVAALPQEKCFIP